jgi:hypothetical protein
MMEDDDIGIPNDYVYTNIYICIIPHIEILVGGFSHLETYESMGRIIP